MPAAKLGPEDRLSRARYSRHWLLLVAAALCLPASAQTPGPAAEGLAARAAAARESGNLPEALNLYQQALSADPQWLQGWWFLGNLQYQANQYAAARDSLSQFIASSPRAVAALALRGLCEYELGAAQESLNDVQQALSLGAANQPRNAQILLYHEALLLTRLGRFEEAISKYTAFAKQGLLNDDVATGLGLAGLRITTAPAATPPQDLALALGAGRAGLQIAGGDTASGRAAFQQLYAANPQRANLHFLCGYLLLSTDPDQGIEEIRRELAVAPGSKPAHTMLAWTLELRGEYAEALPVALEAVREDDALSTNQLVLGRALLETDDVKSALPHIQKVLALEPQNLEAHISLAKAYSALGRKDEAHQERLVCLQLEDQGRPHAP